MKLIKNLAIRFSRPNLGYIKKKKTDGKMTCERSPCSLSFYMYGNVNKENTSLM